jgi:hypothetical protein
MDKDRSMGSLLYEFLSYSGLNAGGLVKLSSAAASGFSFYLPYPYFAKNHTCE